MQSIVDEVVQLGRNLVYIDGDLGVPIGEDWYSVCTGTTSISTWILLVIVGGRATKTKVPNATIKELSDKQIRLLDQQIVLLRHVAKNTDRYTLAKAFESERY